jgi:hypothetical protein
MGTSPASSSYTPITTIPDTLVPAIAAVAMSRNSGMVNRISAAASVSWFHLTSRDQGGAAISAKDVGLDFAAEHDVAESYIARTREFYADSEAGAPGV